MSTKSSGCRTFAYVCGGSCTCFHRRQIGEGSVKAYSGVFGRIQWGIQVSVKESLVCYG